MIKLITIIAFATVLQACSTTEPKPMRDPISVYKDGLAQGSQAMIKEVQNRLRQKQAYGTVEPYYPLRLPPDIRKVWIVEHPNEAGDLIQGHWVFMILEPGRWASSSVPPIHPKTETKIPSAIPMIEDKPGVPAPAIPNKRNDSQGE